MGGTARLLVTIRKTTLPHLMTTPTRRRWFRFSLRTFFVIVALLAVPIAWVAKEAARVRERTAVAQWMSDHSTFSKDGTPTPPGAYMRGWHFDGYPPNWWNNVLGEWQGVAAVWYPTTATPVEIDRVQKAFPEATVRPWSELELSE